MTISHPHPKTIILTGGGTGGSVTPLLALVSDFQKDGYEVAWIGTHHGLERRMVEESHVSYFSVNSGKWRRYFSLQNIIDFFKILIGFFESLVIVNRLKPSLVMTAGGFVSVPVVWAAWILGYRIIVHQQDIKPGLANKLMAPFASRITVSFPKSIEDYGAKAVLTGNPVRREFREIQVASGAAVGKEILVMGGGTGSEAINILVKEKLRELTDLAVVTHITGENDKPDEKIVNSRYHVSTFMTAAEIAQVMSRATVVVSRAGLGTLTELAYLGKASILIPMPYSHQEDNARYTEEKKAAMVLHQDQSLSHKFVFEIQDLLENNEKRISFEQTMSELMPRDANEAVLRVAKEVIEQED